MSFTTYSDLASRPEVQKLIAAEIEKVNASLPPFQQVRKFVLLYKELDADDGELTRTRKVRRGVIAEKYGNIIDAIYSDADQRQDRHRDRLPGWLPPAHSHDDASGQLGAAPAQRRSA